jgi:hypothetical protein
MANGGTARPAASVTQFNITVSGLASGQTFVLCRYSRFAAVPTSRFGVCWRTADQYWIQNATDATWSMTENGLSSDMRIYRAAYFLNSSDPGSSSSSSDSSSSSTSSIIIYVAVGGAVGALLIGISVYYFWCRSPVSTAKVTGFPSASAAASAPASTKSSSSSSSSKVSKGDIQMVEQRAKSPTSWKHASQQQLPGKASKR